MTEPLRMGATIGILGGGQLGRMLAVAASRLGFRTHVFEPGATPSRWRRGTPSDHGGVRKH